jgi:IS30 family transposase
MKRKTKSGTKKVHFGHEERVKVEACRNDGFGVRAIARKIERPRGSVSDEIGRNAVAGECRAEKAGMKRCQRYWRARHQHLKVVVHDGLRKHVREKLKRFWSPEGTAGRLTHAEKSLPSLGKDAVYASSEAPTAARWNNISGIGARKRNRTYHEAIPRAGPSSGSGLEALENAGFSVIGKPTSSCPASVVRERSSFPSSARAATRPS